MRLPRWFTAAGQIFDEQREIEEQDEDASVSRRLRDRTASLVGSHPVVVASFLGAHRWRPSRSGSLLGPDPLHGGALGPVPGLVARVLRRAGVRLPDDGTRRNARGESLARSDGRALVALVREHGDRTEGVAGAAGRSWRPSCCTERSRGSPAVRARPWWAPSPTGCPRWCCGASPTAASRSWWRCASCPSSSSDSRSRSVEGELPDGRWRFIAGLARRRSRWASRSCPGVALAVGGARRRAVPLRFGSRDAGSAIAAAASAARRGAAVPVRAHDDLRWRRGSGFDDRHHRPRLAGAAGAGRRAGHVDRSPRSCRSPRCSRSRWSARSTGASRAVRSLSAVAGFGARVVLVRPATCPGGRRTRRSTSRSPRWRRRWSSASGSRRSSPDSAASRSGSGRSGPRCWPSSSAPGSLLQADRRDGRRMGGRRPGRAAARLGRRVEQRQGRVPRGVGGRGHGDARSWRPAATPWASCRTARHRSGSG